MAKTFSDGDGGAHGDAEIARLRAALEAIERARPHHYQMAFEDHASFAQRLKAMARAALQPVT